jgi:hypothetical protein
MGAIEGTALGDSAVLGDGEGVAKRRITGGVGETVGRALSVSTVEVTGGIVAVGAAGFSADSVFKPFKNSSGLNFDQNGAAFDAAVPVEEL